MKPVITQSDAGSAGSPQLRDGLSQLPQPMTTEPKVIRWQAAPERRAAAARAREVAQQCPLWSGRAVTVSDEVSAERESNCPPAGKPCPSTGIFGCPLSLAPPAKVGIWRR